MSIETSMNNLNGKDISIIIPSYNDTVRLRTLLEELDKTTFFAGAEIIVAADGDETVYDVIHLFKNKDIKITYSKDRRGKGGAILDGIKMSTQQSVGFIDADKPIKLEEFRALFAMLPTYDAIIASRKAAGASIYSHPPYWRRIASRAFNLMFRIIFGMKIYDTQCGAKAFTRKSIMDVLPYIIEKGWAFDIDILTNLHKKFYTILEFPVGWYYRDGSRLQFKDIREMFFSLLRIWWRIR